MDEPQVDPEDTADAGSGDTSGASLSGTATGTAGASGELTVSRVTFRDEAGLVLGSVEISDFKIEGVVTVEVADFAVVTESTQVEVIPTDASPKMKSGRHRALKPPTAPFVFPNEPGHRALTFTMTSKPDDWHVDGERTVLYTPLIDPSRKQQLAVTFEHQAVADPLALITEMIPAGDGTALKVLLALPALFFEHNPGHAFNEVNEISIPDLMRYMGLAQRKKGGFDHDDQKRVWDAIRFISRLWIPAITAHTKGGVRMITGDGAWHSPVIVLQGIQEGPQGARLPKAIRYSLGKEFHAYYTGEVGKRTRMLQLSPRIMELHGKNDLNPLRLAVYYASQFRINKQGAKYGQGGVDVKYGHLLEQAGVPLDRPNPRRQFSRVIGWHQELARKGIIGDLHYPELPKGAGLADYLGTLFTVTPP